MYICRITIQGFRGAKCADIKLRPHNVLIGANNSGKTTIIEALALLLGRDRLVRRLTEHDFYGSKPTEASRIQIVATITDFPRDDPAHSPNWFGMESGVEKWLDTTTGMLHADRNDSSWKLAVQIGFAARFDIEELEAETKRFFVDDETSLKDPFDEGLYTHTVPFRALQELGFFLVPVSRTWDRWISFTSDLFKRVLSTLGGIPAETVRRERELLWNPPQERRFEDQDGLLSIVESVNTELGNLLSETPKLQLRLTATDSDSILEAVVPHYQLNDGPPLPTVRQGSGLVSMQSLLLLMQLGRARAESDRSFVLAVEEPELHIQPSQQKRLVNRLNAVCNQTICTTHSPTAASIFKPSEILYICNTSGTLTAQPLVDQEPAQPTNHEQHLFYAWRQRLVAALMHDCVLVPEGPSDLAWLEALQTAVESRQEWDVEDSEPARFGTFVGIAPTTDAKIEETVRVVQSVHPRPTVLLDGDQAGESYFSAVASLQEQPKVVVFWPEGWAIERVIAWIADADAPHALSSVGDALGTKFDSAEDLFAHLQSRKSYAPTQETTATTLMTNESCLSRTRTLLSSLSDVLNGSQSPSDCTELFVEDRSVSTSTMRVFRMNP